MVNTRSSAFLPLMTASTSRARNRGTGTVRDWCDFGVPRDYVAADVGERPADVDPAAGQVDVADTQGRSFAPAQARVAEQEDEHAPSSSFGWGGAGEAGSRPFLDKIGNRGNSALRRAFISRHLIGNINRLQDRISDVIWAGLARIEDKVGGDTGHQASETRVGCYMEVVLPGSG
jgi:hypothetical protein